MIGSSGSFMRVREVASELCVSTSRVYRLIAGGAVPAVRVGGRVLVPRAAWNAWIERTSRHSLASLTDKSRIALKRVPRPARHDRGGIREP
jgi:excisionase family DNA binding protein